MTKSRWTSAPGFCWLLIAAALVAGCAAGDARFSPTEPAGFWIGLWHGLIACVTLVVGIFWDGVEIYERNNTGGWYDLGFLIGTSLFAGSGHKSHGAWRKSKSRLGELDSLAKGGSASLKVDLEWTGDQDEAKDEKAKDE